MRVAVLFDNLGPYHVARLLAASQLLDVLALEVRPRSRDYDWEVPKIPASLTHVDLLRGRCVATPHWGSMLEALECLVGPHAPDVIAVPGWSTLAAIRTALWAHDRSIPAIVMSDSNALDYRRVRTIENVKGRLVRMFSAGLCAGERQKAYLVKLGLSGDGVFLGYDVVDNEYFAAQADRVQAAGVMPQVSPGRCLDVKWRGRYFLASARFIPMKNLSALIDAYATYHHRESNSVAVWPLVVLGDGPLRHELERRRHELGLDDKVFMPGFKQYSDLPGYYGTAGAFVHVSALEPWGLVVNEAMASGLPVLVSNRCGCAHALVAQGVNGFTFDPLDTIAIADSLQQLVAHPDLPSMGEASRRLIADWGPRRFAEGLCAAALYAHEHGPARLPAGQRLLGRLVAEVNSLRLGDVRHGVTIREGCSRKCSE